MTFPLLNAARTVAVFAVGAGKSRVVRRLAEQFDPETGPGPVPTRLPVTGLKPDSTPGGGLIWCLDPAAAES